MPSIGAWLELEGLAEYAPSFEAQRIDLSVLPRLTDTDLKELGVCVLGDRKRLLAAAAALGQPALAPNPEPDALDAIIAQLPTPLALPLSEYQQETHPVLKLWAACDTVEILLRLIVFLGIGDLGRRGALPEQLRRDLRHPIENPMLGNWRRMAQQVAESLADDTALPELSPLVRNTLVPFLDGPDTTRAVERSFLALRNRLAHGGGISRRLASDLLTVWQGPFEAIWPHLAWLGDWAFVARTDHGYGRLRGPSEAPEPFVPAAPESLATALANAGPIAALCGDLVIPLWPLALFGVPWHPEHGPDPADRPLPQVYLRRGEVSLEYTPLGEATLAQSASDETAMERFLGLFRAPSVALTTARTGFSVAGFEESFRALAKNLRGRTAEREAVRSALDQMSSGILWLDGPAGMGKSYLMADLADERLTQHRDDILILGYQFRAGDPRCSREPFLRFAIERLRAWLPPADDAQDSEKLKNLNRFKALLARLGKRRVLFLLDGLDEIAERDPRFAADLPLRIAGPTLTWLCAGRPELGLPEAFAAVGARRVFPNGLPPMQADDIRTLLLERIGPLRKQLLKQDTEAGERVGNPFIEKVARLSEGLPLYVKYVIDDIHAGRYRVLDAGEALPPGLHAYHEELLRRLGIGNLHQVLTPIAATLAVAKEPLAAPALADLLLRRGRLVPDGDAGLHLVQQGLAAIASMLRRAPTPDGEDGFAPYHHSLAQHMAESAHCRDAVATARGFLADLAEAVPEGPLAPYLFRRGITHLLETGRVPATLALLCRFAYLMARLRTLKGPDAVQGIGGDWQAILAANPALDHRARLCSVFWREREHILRRGTERWPAFKILLQLAVEHADDSPVTREAEAWLSGGECDWVWLRNPLRAARAAPDPCLSVLEGHTDPIFGAHVMPDGRLLSWSLDHTLRLWDGQTGAPLATLAGHTEEVVGALVLPDGRILSWSYDCTLRLWDGQSGAPFATLAGHTQGVVGALVLPNGRILSWSFDCTLRLWDGQSGAPLATLAGHTEQVEEAEVLPDGRILSRSVDRTMRLWNGKSGAPLATLTGYSDQVLPDGRVVSRSSDHTLRLRDGQSGSRLATLVGHRAYVTSVQVLPDGRILSTSRDCTLRLWDGQSGAPLATLAGHTGGVLGARILPDGRILSWSGDHTLRLWDGRRGAALATLVGHTGDIWGARALPDGRILSWSGDHTLRLWDGRRGAPLATLVGHTNWVNGTRVLPDGRFLSWSDDCTLRLWDGQIDASPTAGSGHPERTTGAQVLPDGRVLSWSEGDTLRLLDSQSGAPIATLAGHAGKVCGARALPDGRILSWSDDHTLRLWDGRSGTPLATLVGHADRVTGAQVLPDGRFLSWSDDYTLRLWHGRRGTPLATLDGHTNGVTGAQVLPDGRVLSWSGDHTLRLWDEQRGAPLATLVGHADRVTGAQVLPDGRILSWSGDHTLRLWDGRRGAALATLVGHTGDIWGARALPDGRILSWSYDRTLRLWDGQTGAPLAMLAGHTAPVGGAQVLPDGRILSWSCEGIMCLWEGTLRLWDGRSGQSLGEPIPETTLPWTDPSLLFQRNASQWPEGNCRRTARWSVANIAGIATRTGAIAPACWHGNSRVAARDLLSDGILVVTLDSGHVFCLQLYRGERRIRIEEYD